MEYPEFKYVDLAIGGVNKRNTVVETTIVREKLPNEEIHLFKIRSFCYERV